MNCDQISQCLHKATNPLTAKQAKKFFKTGKGQYGEGDQFIGIKVPDLRKFAKQFEAIPTAELQPLISSPIHEERMLALLILIRQYKKNQQAVYQFYIDHLRHVNNWDLVDVSAPSIMGQYLLTKDKSILLELADSSILWYRRVSIVATQQFIKNNEFDWTIKIAELLLEDSHDLIHKAVGWMLREMGKRNLEALTIFLDRYTHTMQRTMLRYAIEKMPEETKKHYLKAGKA